MRFGVLCTLVVLAFSWLQRQVEYTVGELAASSTLVAFLVPAARRLWAVFSPTLEEDFKGAVRSCVKYALRTRVLTVLSLVVLVLSSFVSTVTVIPGEAELPLPVYLESEEDTRIVPWIQAIQISPNTIVKSMTPPHDTSTARVCAACAMTTT